MARALGRGGIPCLLLDAASLASILVVTAPGEELSSLFPVAQMEIGGGRTEQAWLQCANWAHNKFLTHLGVPPPRPQALHIHKYQLHIGDTLGREVKEKRAMTLQISSQLFTVSL